MVGVYVRVLGAVMVDMNVHPTCWGIFMVDVYVRVLGDFYGGHECPPYHLD
jgi:hypothetical protein